MVLAPLLPGRDAVVHPEAEAWVRRAICGPLLDRAILRENLRVLFRRPGRYLSTLFGLAADLWARPKDLLGLLALFPRSVWLGRHLRELGVRHVHAQFATYAAAAAYVLCRVHDGSGPDLPFSVTVHGSDLFLHQAGLRRKLGAAAFVRAVSVYNARFLQDRLGPAIPDDRLCVIHCGVDPDRFRRRLIPGRPGIDRPARVLSVAALIPSKGVRYLAEAIAQLRVQNLDVQCDVIGEGPRRHALERRIRRTGLHGVMRLLGQRSGEDVIRAFSRADLFVLASATSTDGKQEGIPVSLMEAMASGVPVVTTRIAGIPELVVDGVTGRLVAPGDADALARALRETLESAEASERLADAARTKVRQEFSLSECVRRLAAEIELTSIPIGDGNPV